MPNIIVVDLNGKEHRLSCNVGETLMEPLRDAGMVEATCGGAASCGTCHVYLQEDWVSKCGERTEDEGYMLEGLEEFVEIKNVSRLACQIQITEQLSGINLKIAPQI